MNTQNLNYIYTRLGIEGISNVYLIINEITNVLEIQKPRVVLDNERLKKETSIELNIKDYKILVEYFKKLQGKKLKHIDIEQMKTLWCSEIYELEDEELFITIEESLYQDSEVDEEEIVYTMTLTDKVTQRYHSIELDKETYVVLAQYRGR